MPHKRPLSPPSLQEDSLLLTCSSSHDSTEPPCAKRTSHSPPCNINYIHSEQEAATAAPAEAGKHEENKDYRSDDLDEILGCADDSEAIGGAQWDADERLILEMMYSLEQAIGSNVHTDDSSSCSSSPRTNTSSNCASASSSAVSAWDAIGDNGEPNSEYRALESKFCFNLLDDCSASIDEEIQAMLQQASDDPNFCRNFDIPSNSDYNFNDANSAADYAYADDRLGLVNSSNYPLLVDFDCFTGPFNCP